MLCKLHNTEVLEWINLFHWFTVDDNRTNDSYITTEVDAHFFRFGNKCYGNHLGFAWFPRVAQVHKIATRLIICPWLFRIHLLTSPFQRDIIVIISVLMFTLIVMTDSKSSALSISSEKDQGLDPENSWWYTEGFQNKIYERNRLFMVHLVQEFQESTRNPTSACGMYAL